MYFLVPNKSLKNIFFFSSSDDAYCSTLISSLETIPAKDFVASIVAKVLISCLRLSQKTEVNHLHEAGMPCFSVLIISGLPLFIFLSLHHIDTVLDLLYFLFF